MDEPKLGKNTGNAGKGRPKGSGNKVSIEAKQAIALVYDKLGGVDEMLIWASDDKNKTIFYTQIWPKIVALTVAGSGDDGEHIHEIIFKVRNGKPGS